MKKKRTIRQDNPIIEEGEKLLKLANLLPEEIMTLHELGAATNALTLPDRFNSAFTKTGWVFVEFCTGAMPAVKALEMHNNGKSEIEIDQYLADNLFNFQALKFQLSKWIGKGVVEPERPEALKVFNRAFHAFEEEDYIVAVPLFLMLVDGLSLSMTGTKSIFSNLEEMDHLFELNTSIGGHGSALKEAVKTMVIAQKGYSEESLSAPLRHGILHGTRLNYANKVVAVKALCIFGALIELLRDSQAPSKRDIKKEKTNL